MRDCPETYALSLSNMLSLLLASSIYDVLFQHAIIIACWYFAVSSTLVCLFDSPACLGTLSFRPYLSASMRLGTPSHHDVDGENPFLENQRVLDALRRGAWTVPFFLTLCLDVSLILPLWYALLSVPVIPCQQINRRHEWKKTCSTHTAWETSRDLLDVDRWDARERRRRGPPCRPSSICMRSMTQPWRGFPGLTFSFCERIIISVCQLQGKHASCVCWQQWLSLWWYTVFSNSSHSMLCHDKNWRQRTCMFSHKTCDVTTAIGSHLRRWAFSSSSSGSRLQAFATALCATVEVQGNEMACLE
jgi:hypothetical protein